MDFFNGFRQFITSFRRSSAVTKFSVWATVAGLGVGAVGTYFSYAPAHSSPTFQADHESTINQASPGGFVIGRDVVDQSVKVERADNVTLHTGLQPQVQLNPNGEIQKVSQTVQSETYLVKPKRYRAPPPIHFSDENAGEIKTSLSPWSHELIGHNGAVHCLAFSKDGLILATGGDDNTVRVWDLKRLRAIGRFDESTHAPRAISVSTDGTFLAWAGERTPVRLVSRSEPHQVDYLDAGWFVSALTFSPDMKNVAVGAGRFVKVFAIADGLEHHSFEWTAVNPSYVYSVAYSEDNLLAAGGRGGEGAKWVWVWNGGTGIRRTILTGDAPTSGYDICYGDVAFSRDGKLAYCAIESQPAAASGSIGILKKWIVNDGLAVEQFDIPGGNNMCLRLREATDDVIVAIAQLPRSVGERQTARISSTPPTSVTIWSKTTTATWVINLPGGQVVRSIQLSPDATKLAVGSDGGRIWICPVPHEIPKQ